MLSAERTQRLIGMLRQEKTLSVTGAARRLGVSASTIRRDLGLLERQGLASRVHGGAIARRESVAAPAEPPRLSRSAEHAEEKRRIGRVAAGLVVEGETILISGGTTTDAMLPFLGDLARLTVVTNNVHTALEVARHPRPMVVVLGGYLRRDELSLLGHLGADALRHLTVDRAFVSAYAVGLDGLMGAEVRETETDRALIHAARELVVLADAGKFSRTGPARLAPASQIDVLITDDGAPGDVLGALSSQGVKVMTC